MGSLIMCIVSYPIVGCVNVVIRRASTFTWSGMWGDLLFIRNHESPINYVSKVSSALGSLRAFRISSTKNAKLARFRQSTSGSRSPPRMRSITAANSAPSPRGPGGGNRRPPRGAAGGRRSQRGCCRCSISGRRRGGGSARWRGPVRRAGGPRRDGRVGIGGGRRGC